MSQIESLLIGLSQSVGNLTGSLDAFQAQLTELRADHKTMLQRITSLEAAGVAAGTYGSKEHDAVLRRLAEGDGLFKTIKERADEAIARANSAKTTIKTLQDEMEKARQDYDKKHGGTALRRALIVKLAPHVLTVLLNAGMCVAWWLWTHLHVMAAIADALKKGGSP